MQDAAQPLLLRFNLASCAVEIRTKSGRGTPSLFLVCLRRQPRPSAGKISCDVLSMKLHCPLATIMCQTVSCFLSLQSSIFAVGDRHRSKGVTLFTYRPNNKAPAIRCRIYQSDGQSRVEFLNSKYASYACQLDSDSICPFSQWGIRLTTISEPVPGIWRLVRTGAEATGWAINQLLCEIVRSLCRTFHTSLRFKFALAVVI